MHKGKDAQLWWHTAAVISYNANCHVDQKKRPQGFKPLDFHPYQRKRSAVNGMPVNSETMGAFVAIFVPPDKAKEAEEQARKSKEAADQLIAKMRQRMVHAPN